MTWSRQFPRVCTLFLLAIALGLFPAGSTAQEVSSDEVAFRRISNKLMCQCGCNYMVLSCNHVDCPSATYIRRSIKTSLSEGKSDEVILAGFVQEYGVRVLPEPPREGFSWMAWVMPFVGLGLGAVAVSYVILLWKRRETPDDQSQSGDAEYADAASKPEPSAQLVEKYRAQIDEEFRT